jgi:hypothetical protein
MKFELYLASKETTPLSGMVFLMQMLDKLSFKEVMRLLQGVFLIK